MRGDSFDRRWRCGMSRRIAFNASGGFGGHSGTESPVRKAMAQDGGRFLDSRSG